MLTITICTKEWYDEIKEEFITAKEQTLQLEHSLVSISKWEAKWKKPFLSKETQTRDEIIDYIRCMTTTQNVDLNVYSSLTIDQIKEVYAYINAPMTATVIKDKKRSPNREIITSEIIYYQMIALNIPFECQKWHLNRLLTLINVCNIKSSPQKKMSRKEILQQNARINAERRQKMNSRG